MQLLLLNILLIHNKQPNSLARVYALVEDNGCIC